MTSVSLKAFLLMNRGNSIAFNAGGSTPELSIYSRGKVVAVLLHRKKPRNFNTLTSIEFSRTDGYAILVFNHGDSYEIRIPVFV